MSYDAATTPNLNPVMTFTCAAMRHLFESVVGQCMVLGFVGGTDKVVPIHGLRTHHCRAVDGSTIKADANKNRLHTLPKVKNIWSCKKQVQRRLSICRHLLKG